METGPASGTRDGSKKSGYALDSRQWTGTGIEDDAECCRVHTHNTPRFPMLQHKISRTISSMEAVAPKLMLMTSYGMSADRFEIAA